MPQDVWTGGIFLKEEGGYEIVLRALEHYIRRLKSIDKSPELRDAPMFVQIVRQEASKAGPAAERLIEKIKNALQDAQSIGSLRDDIPLIERALECYSADIQKSQSGEDKFYAQILAGNGFALIDFPNINTAIKRLKQFS